MRQQPMFGFVPGLHAGYISRVTPVPAGASAVENSISGMQWLQWLAPQRIAYLKSHNPIQRGESVESYARRISMLSTKLTVEATRSHPIAPAGQTAFGGLGDWVTNQVDDANSTGGTGGAGDKADGSGGGSNIGASIITGAAQVLGMAAQTIVAIISSNNATERQRLQNEAQAKLAELQSQRGASNDPANQQNQMMLQQLLAQMNGGGLSTNAMIAIGIGAVVLVGGAVYFMASNRRRNPVMSELGRDGRRHRNFVSAARLRKLRSRSR